VYPVKATSTNIGCLDDHECKSGDLRPVELYPNKHQTTASHKLDLPDPLEPKEGFGTFRPETKYKPGPTSKFTFVGSSKTPKPPKKIETILQLIMGAP
jgi:hypothetical protein